MGEPVKGTVTSSSSIFSPEEAQKASMSVQETISERQKEVDQLQGFLNDNINLINLVKKLPDQLHHDIMVPFGKAAFFPGRLIHTNEFLVLLGEGYFAERTSKQTTEILKRRGKDLESQIESLKAVMQDLKVEASFFNNTAAEAAEGLVEIREDYIDEASNEDKSIAVSGDEEYARIFARIEELEKEELEELEEENAEECEEDDEADLGQVSLEPEVRCSEEQSKYENSIRERSMKDHSMQNLSNQYTPEGSMVHPESKDLSSHGNVPASSRSNISGKIIELPGLKENEFVAPVSQNEVSTHSQGIGSYGSKAFTGSIIKHAHNIESNPREQKPGIGVGSNSSNAFTSSIIEHTYNIESNPREQKPGMGSNSSKAFTGSIIEHTHNMESNPREQKPAIASKPVSRFKLQRK